MKKLNLAMAGSVLLSLVVFQGCQNCDEPVKTAQSACESRLTAVKDSISGAYKSQIDSLNAEYSLQIGSLQTQLADALESKSTTKKPTANTTKKEEPKSNVTKSGQSPAGTDEQKPKVTKGGQPK